MQDEDFQEKIFRMSAFLLAITANASSYNIINYHKMEMLSNAASLMILDLFEDEPNFNLENIKINIKGKESMMALCELIGIVISSNKEATQKERQLALDAAEIKMALEFDL